MSLVDVHGSPTFTLWLCKCNLRCPFCHNWRLAVNDPKQCRVLDIEVLIDELEHSKFLIDYLHVTGGEPLMQYRGLAFLFRYVKENLSIRNSLNTNSTLFNPLKTMLERELVDHVATDLKTPFHELIGLPRNASEKLWKTYLRSLELITDYNIPLELRLPVAKGFERKIMFGEILQVLKIVEKGIFYVVVEPLLSEPVTDPRDREWCRIHCYPSMDELEYWADFLRRNGVDRVYVRKFIEA